MRPLAPVARATRRKRSSGARPRLAALALCLAGSVAAATPLASASTAIYQIVAANGYAERDFSCVFNLISGRLGRTPTTDKDAR